VSGRGGNELEAGIARLLTAGTYASVALLAIGVLAMAFAGRSPRDASPPLDPGRLLGDVLALRPEGFLWLGLILVIATPSARVAASLIGFLRRGERPMAAVSAAILGIIVLSVILGFGTDA
jgi:uncharacterized membrane protein